MEYPIEYYPLKFKVLQVFLDHETQSNITKEQAKIIEDLAEDIADAAIDDAKNRILFELAATQLHMGNWRLFHDRETNKKYD